MPAFRERVPDTERTNDERNLFLGQPGEQSEGNKGPEAILVEVPNRERQQGARERHRVELVQRQPLHRRVGQIGQSAECPRPIGAEVLAAQPEERKRPVSKARCSSAASAPKPAAKTAMPAQTTV